MSEITVNEDMKMADFKNMILSLPELQAPKNTAAEQLRVREKTKFNFMGKHFSDPGKTLKQLKLCPELVI